MEYKTFRVAKQNPVTKQEISIDIMVPEGSTGDEIIRISDGVKPSLQLEGVQATILINEIREAAENALKAMETRRNNN